MFSLLCNMIALYCNMTALFWKLLFVKPVPQIMGPKFIGYHVCTPIVRYFVIYEVTKTRRFEDILLHFKTAYKNKFNSYNLGYCFDRCTGNTKDGLLSSLQLSARQLRRRKFSKDEILDLMESKQHFISCYDPRKDVTHFYLGDKSTANTLEKQFSASETIVF
jgi:hypothetical protein